MYLCVYIYYIILIPFVLEKSCAYFPCYDYSLSSAGGIVITKCMWVVCVHVCHRQQRNIFYRQITGYGMSVNDHRVA